ncbi:Protein of unknown function [Actinomadura madurae]|uniref:DUF4238 domain-containing protein n=1 Tax=Actinomadura madurae TaxID=1993 RepID=A0A1I4ZEA9_9ACTN|nr:DUF4238 domain-containing protein [Actinomadura madurae]SFN48200.1 Protein of unknown function [Actinomadura madurae]
MANAKKHHFVPQFLLRRFADTNEKLIVHRLGARESFISTVRNVGHRNLGHTVVRPGQEPDHTSMETAMSLVEGEAASAIAKLDSIRLRRVPDEFRSPIAWFLALQWYRNRFLFHIMSERMDPQKDQLDADLLKYLVLSNLSMSVLSPWAIRDDPQARPKDTWNPLVSELLSSEMNWSCYRPRGMPLIVSDTSVCFSGARDGFTADVPAAYLDHGVGAGFHDARRITVPLGSNLGLLISRDERDADRIRAAEFNRYTIFNSREFIAYAPDWPTRHPSLNSELHSNLFTQRIVAPTFMWGYKGNV